MRGHGSLSPITSRSSTTGNDCTQPSAAEAIAADANLGEEHITHAGRHAFATTLIRGGTDLVTVADMLGHARLDTDRTYTHPTAAGLTKALTLLPQDR